MSVTIGSYRITGTAHVGSDTRLDAEFVARQPFLPLTSASLLHVGGRVEAVDVVIVNLAVSTRVVPA